MKEYITKIIHEDKNITIGTNGHAILVGQKDDWVVLEKSDIRVIGGCLAKHFDWSVLKGFSLLEGQDELLLTQENNTVCINKSIFNSLLAQRL